MRSPARTRTPGPLFVSRAVRVSGYVSVALWGLTFASCNRVRETASISGYGKHDEAPRAAETVHAPSRLEGIELGPPNGAGNQRVACATCHSREHQAKVPESMNELTQFHRGLGFRHGTLSCRSCHREGQPPKLGLADGTELEVTEALRLCAQCHGPQYRDYQHGAHGGVSGHWDLRFGPRFRNHCVDCHDPHQPQILPVTPVPPPRDRFFTHSTGRGE